MDMCHAEWVGGGERISTGTCHVMSCFWMFHHLLLLLCTATCSSTSSWSNRCCCRGSGMRTRRGRMGLGWRGWVRILRWERGRRRGLGIESNVSKHFREDIVPFENRSLLNWVDIKKFCIFKVFQPIVKLHECVLDCFDVDYPRIHYGVNSARVKEWVQGFNHSIYERGCGRYIARPDEVTGIDKPQSEHILAFFEGAREASGEERGEWKGQGVHPLVDRGAIQTSFSGSGRISPQSEVDWEMRRSWRAAFWEISGWHWPSIHSDRLSSARRWKINRENQELEVIEGNELAQHGNKSRSSNWLAFMVSIPQSHPSPLAIH